MLLSVVVPFYGVEAYIGACLDALRPLPCEEAEILLVDDCGTDGSRAIAEAFCHEQPNARLLTRAANGGLSAARNTGLDAAQGEYVFFLDSDDVPDANAILTLTRRAQQERLDVAKGCFTMLDDDTGALRPGPALPRTEPMPGGTLFADECRAGLYEPMVWQCLYRRAFLEEIGLRMAEGLLFEDELFQAPALLRASRAASELVSLLRYRQRAGSIMTSFARSARWCDSYLAICRRLSPLADGAEEPAASALRRRVAQIALSLARNLPAYGLTGAVYDEAYAFLKEHRREIAAYAKAAGGTLALEGALLGLSPGAYLAAYRAMRGGRNNQAKKHGGAAS